MSHGDESYNEYADLPINFSSILIQSSWNFHRSLEVSKLSYWQSFRSIGAISTKNDHWPWCKSKKSVENIIDKWFTSVQWLSTFLLNGIGLSLKALTQMTQLNCCAHGYDQLSNQFKLHDKTPKLRQSKQSYFARLSKAFIIHFC